MLDCGIYLAGWECATWAQARAHTHGVVRLPVRTISTILARLSRRSTQRPHQHRVVQENHHWGHRYHRGSMHMAKHQAARADVMQGGGRARHRLAGEGVSSARGVNIELKAVECIDVGVYT